MITSRENRQVKRARSLRRRKGRQAERAYLVEGVRATLDALRSGATVEQVFISEQMLPPERAMQLRQAAEETGADVVEVSAGVLRSIAQSQSPQGVVAVLRKPEHNLKGLDLKQPALVLVAHEVRDPGNLGTMVRTAHSAGCSVMVVSGESVDPYNEKSVRASMSSLAHIPVVDGVSLEDVTVWAKQGKLRLVATTPWAQKTCFETDMTGSVALLVGGEAWGLGELAELADEVVSVPMPGGTESLNVAVAAGILLFETVRQRYFRT